MKHRLAITVGQSKIVERAFDAAGVTCHIETDEPGFDVITRLHAVDCPGCYFEIVNDYYTESTGAVLFPEDGVDALLAVLKWFVTEFHNSTLARILVSATRQALCCHELISDADREESSIDSGDAIDRCYDAVRVVLPEYTTSSDIEP